MTNKLEWLKTNIAFTFGRTAIHLRTASIWEVCGGLSWEGNVEVFSLIGTPKTDQFFVFWTNGTHDTNRRKAWLVPSTSNITTPNAAVRSYLARSVTGQDSAEQKCP